VQQSGKREQSHTCTVDTLDSDDRASDDLPISYAKDAATVPNLRPTGDSANSEGVDDNTLSVHPTTPDAPPDHEDDESHDGSDADFDLSNVDVDSDFC
jgi:hypothetical protein